jgi:hypothetical protein
MQAGLGIRGETGIRLLGGFRARGRGALAGDIDADVDVDVDEGDDGVHSCLADSPVMRKGTVAVAADPAEAVLVVVTMAPVSALAVSLAAQ